MKRSTTIAAAALFAGVMSASPLTAIPAAQTARSMSSLSAQERVGLPGATKVVFQGHTVTLGVLRAQHAALVKRFANASAAGRRAGESANRTLGKAPKAPGKYTPVVEPASQYATAPQDMKAFCNAAHAAVCLYYPASATLTHFGSSASQTDPFITDSTLCTSEGGVTTPPGCQFLYPLAYTAQFNPGTAGPFGHKANCALPHWQTPVYDPHGAVSVSSQAWVTTSTGATPSICVVRVWTKN